MNKDHELHLIFLFLHKVVLLNLKGEIVEENCMSSVSSTTILVLDLAVTTGLI